MIAAALFALLVCGQEAEAPRATDKWKIEFKLSIVKEEDGAWVFSIAGSTNLPSGAELRARVYAIEMIDDAGPRGKGRREDEEPLVWEGDEDAGQPAFKMFNPGADGSFKLDVYRFARKPWSIPYRARVHYTPNLQKDDVRAKLGDVEFSRGADLRVGTPAEYAAELRERTKEVHEDLVEVEALFHEIKKAFAGQKEKPDLEAWRVWKDPWYRRVETLEERNKQRFGMWVVWMERQAKMRVGGMCVLLRSLLNKCGEYLKGEKEAVRPTMFDDFFGYLEEAVEVIGIHMPLPVEKVKPVVEAYEKGFAPVRAWIEKGEGEWSPARRVARRECSAALFDLLPILQNRKRAYKFVDDLSGRLRELIEAADRKAAPAALREALRSHDLALAGFRRYSGLDGK